MEYYFFVTSLLSFSLFLQMWWGVPAWTWLISVGVWAFAMVTILVFRYENSYHQRKAARQKKISLSYVQKKESAINWEMAQASFSEIKFKNSISQWLTKLWDSFQVQGLQSRTIIVLLKKIKKYRFEIQNLKAGQREIFKEMEGYRALWNETAKDQVLMKKVASNISKTWPETAFIADKSTQPIAPEILEVEKSL